MSDSINSIDLDLLQAHIKSNSDAAAEARHEVSLRTTQTEEVTKLSPGNHWAGTGIPSVEKVLEVWETNGAAAGSIHAELSKDHTGIATVLGSVLAGILAASGHTKPASITPFEEGSATGLEPLSGFADDPISTYNGNFVQIEQDSATGGMGSLIDTRRIYNSLRHHEPGRFGDGWSSILDMGLEWVGDNVIRVTLADGAVVSFVSDGTGGYRPAVRRLLRLERLSSGLVPNGVPPTGPVPTFVLQEAHERTYHFSAEGLLLGGTFGPASFSLGRDEGRLIISQPSTGRNITYRTNPDGLIISAETSAGHRTDYEYDQRLCTRVTGPLGAFDYEYDEQLLVRRRDADEVQTFFNTYDPGGRVLTQQAPHGIVSNYEYLDDRSTRLTYEGGAVNVYVHDDRARLTALFGADGRAMRTTYDDLDRVVRVVDRTGTTTGYRYDDDLNDIWTARLDPSGASEHRAFDEQGRCTVHTDVGGGTHRFEYEADNRSPVVVTDPLLGRTETRFDHHWLPVESTDADGYRTTVERDRDGLAVKITDGAHRESQHRYDEHGRLVESIDRMGRRVTLNLGEDGQITELVDEENNHIELDYTPGGRTSTVRAKGDLVWKAEYGPHGDVSRITNATGDHIELSYDKAGNCVAQTTSSGQTVRFEYDVLGQMVAATTASGHRVERTITPAARTISTVDAGGATASYRLDEAGRLAEHTTGDGATVRYQYHPSGQISRCETESGTIEIEFDEAARPVAEVDQAGARRTRRYSTAGRLMAETSPSGSEVSFDYDEAGHLLSIIDSDGRDVIAEYNPAQQSALTPYQNEIPTVLDLMQTRCSSTWPAFGAGYASLLSAGSGRVEPYDGLTRDERGVLTSAVDGAGTTTDFSSDFYGRPVELTTNDATTTVSYDDTNEVVSITNPLGQTVSATRLPTGQLLELDIPGSDPVLHHYDDARRLSATTKGGDRLLEYSYDNRGRVVEAVNAHGAVSVEYGNTGSVISVSGIDGQTTRYESDADGMVIARVAHDGAALFYERSAAGRILAITDADGNRSLVPADFGDGLSLDRTGRITVDRQGRNFSYDLAGRLSRSTGADGTTSRFGYNDLGFLAREQSPNGDRTYRYNTAAQLVALSSTDGVTTFSYDTLGRRTHTLKPDGSTVRYVWNGLNQLVETARIDAEGTELRRSMIYSGLGRVERVDNTAIGWDDAITEKPVSIGSQRFLRSGLKVKPADDPDAEWTDGTFDDPWGHDERTGIRLGYRNELAVDDLVFVGERVYDPSTRTFLSADPLPTIPGANAFASPYVYAINDPINQVDPSGRRPLTLGEFEEVKARLETSRFERIGKKALLYGGIALVVLTAPVWIPIVVPALASAGVFMFKAYLTLKLASIAADMFNFEQEWNQFYTRFVAQPILSGLQSIREEIAHLQGVDPSANPRGDFGGTFDSDHRRPFIITGSTPLERGLANVTTALDHTMDNNQIRSDEFEIIDHGNGSYTVVLPGVADLSAAGAGLNHVDYSVRDTDVNASLSFGSGSSKDNEYAQYVKMAMAKFGVPTGANIMLVGHSYGSDTALDLAMDSSFTDTYNLTHVVAAAYDSEKQLKLGQSIDQDIEVLVLKNNADKVVTVEEWGGTLLAEPEGDYGTDHAIIRNFDGKGEGAGHHPNNYIDYLKTTDDRQVRDFLESVGTDGYADSGRSYALDVSRTSPANLTSVR